MKMSRLHETELRKGSPEHKEVTMLRKSSVDILPHKNQGALSRTILKLLNTLDLKTSKCKHQGNCGRNSLFSFIKYLIVGMGLKTAMSILFLLLRRRLSVSNV